MKKLRNAKVHTLVTALEAGRKYCAYQERSQMEVRNKLYELGLNSHEVEQAIVALIEENFINEERFARAYARGKFRIKKWGKIKIERGLKSRNISSYCIRMAFEEIDNKEYLSTLDELLEQISHSVSESDLIKRNFIIAQKATARGFEPDIVWNQIKLLY